MSSNTSKDLIYCPKCKDYRSTTIKIFNTVVCNACNTIITSDKGIDKVG